MKWLRKYDNFVVLISKELLLIYNKEMNTIWKDIKNKHKNLDLIFTLYWVFGFFDGLLYLPK